MFECKYQNQLARLNPASAQCPIEPVSVNRAGHCPAKWVCERSCFIPFQAFTLLILADASKDCNSVSNDFFFFFLINHRIEANHKVSMFNTQLSENTSPVVYYMCDKPSPDNVQTLDSRFSRHCSEFIWESGCSQLQQSPHRFHCLVGLLFYCIRLFQNPIEFILLL